MFETGKKVHLPGGQFGTIFEKIDENAAFVTLKVRSSDGECRIVKRINPDKEHVKMVENQYREHGCY